MAARGFFWCPHCSKPHFFGTARCEETGKELDPALYATKGTTHRLVGTVLAGKYKILRLLGAGGVGEVFGAENTALRRKVAIKTLLTPTPDAATRLTREAQLLASLNHPNICGVYDVGTMPDGSPFLVLEWLQGITLTEQLRLSGPLTGLAARHLFTQILAGLHAAHEASIVHRDVKPDNICLVDGGRSGPMVKIMDFGFAKDLSATRGSTITQKGSAVGTAAYMSPEQLSGVRVDRRSDLFAVGVGLHEALCGRNPFFATTRMELQVNILRSPPASFAPLRSDVPQQVGMVIARALEKGRDERFATAREMEVALAGAFDHG